MCRICEKENCYRKTNCAYWMTANAFRAALSRMSSVEPLTCKICCCLRSASNRLTVSREVLIILRDLLVGECQLQEKPGLSGLPVLRRCERGMATGRNGCDRQRQPPAPTASSDKRICDNVARSSRRGPIRKGPAAGALSSLFGGRAELWLSTWR
jgi:hypothetical protein